MNAQATNVRQGEILKGYAMLRVLGISLAGTIAAAVVVAQII